MAKMEFNLSFHLFLFFLVVGLASSGEVRDFGGLKTYISGSPNSKKSIILISDIFGYENPQLRQLADKVAGAGFYAVLPDFFYGDPYTRGNSLNLWLKKHSPEKGFEDAKPIIESLKSKGITKIGTAGFCWGGKVSVLLSSNCYNQVEVLLHPVYVEPKDMEGVKVPTSILGGERDDIVTPAQLKQLADVLKAKPEIDSFLKMFPGAEHAWTIHYNETNPHAVKAAKEAQNDMLYWLVKYLK